MAIRVYLDTCCLCRPFDDPSIDRNRLEAEAVLAILRRVYRGDLEMIASEALSIESNLIASDEKREQVKGFLALKNDLVSVTSFEDQRMAGLTSLGFKAMDALHIACAESGGCDVFLTTDDRLKRMAERLPSELKVRVDNPLSWLQGQFHHGDDRNDAE